MPFLTVCVAVIHEGQVLLTKRDDFRIWCLPSGGVDDKETVAEAAIRETREETGLDVELTRLVGSILVQPSCPRAMQLCLQPGQWEGRSVLSRERPLK